MTMEILRVLTIGSVGGENEKLAGNVVEVLFQVKKCDDIIRGSVRALGDAVLKMLGSQA